MKTCDLKKLKNNIADCTECSPHLPLGAKPIVQIHPEAKILIAGQAPGRKVHETGIPFDDASGDRLRDWMGVDKSIFYNPKKMAIVPMGFCYPGTGKSGDLPPRAECAQTWREAVLSALGDIELTLVIGQYALGWHLKKQKKDNLTETVRNWEEYWPNILPLPHPSPRNNIWLKRNSWFVRDVLPKLRSRVRDLI